MSERNRERVLALGDGKHSVNSLVQLHVPSLQDRRGTRVFLDGLLLTRDDMNYVPPAGDQVWIEWDKRADAVTLLGELADGGSES